MSFNVRGFVAARLSSLGLDPSTFGLAAATWRVRHTENAVSDAEEWKGLEETATVPPPGSTGGIVLRSKSSGFRREWRPNPWKQRPPA